MTDTPQLLLTHHLTALKLPSFLREYDKLARQCAAEGVDYPRYLLRLAELELIERERRSVERRIKEARFPATKSLDSFNFLALPSLNKALVRELARCEYIARRENIIALGNSGTGKTHLALGLGLAACQKGLSVGFTTAAALVHELISFAPGEAYQFDWSHEVVLINGTTVTVKVAHIRLCHSRMLFVRAYPRETQEMVFDAHDRAFAFFKGACTRGIYDNMKTAVETIFVGRERAYNRRFLRMCSHYLVDPVACNPASGWEKGQVENQVGLVRERFFTPRLRVKNYAELNAWLLDQCVAYAKAHRHPELREQTVWQMFEAERPSLVAYAGRFDGFHAVPAAVSKTCLVQFDKNKCSVSARAVGRPVEIRAYADRIELRQDGRVVGDHRRCFGRDQARRWRSWRA